MVEKKVEQWASNSAALSVVPKVETSLVVWSVGTLAAWSVVPSVVYSAVLLVARKAALLVVRKAVLKAESRVVKRDVPSVCCLVDSWVERLVALKVVRLADMLVAVTVDYLVERKAVRLGGRSVCMTALQ